MATTKFILSQIKIEGVLRDLISKSDGENVQQAINTAISNLVGGAPETADTLVELFNLIESNTDAVTLLNDAILTKVDKVEGKGLSTEDFTTAEKNKLNGIAEGANKTEITKTLNDSETTVPSNKAVSDGLTAKVDKNNIVKTIDSSNNTALDKVPSCAAVAAYVDSNISGAMDFTVAKDTNAATVSVTDSTNGLCAVRITKMSDGSVQYQSSINALGGLANRKTAFTFNIIASEYYMIEAWFYNSDTKKLVPAAVKYS